MLGVEVVGLRDGRLLVASVATVQLLLVGCLVIDEELGIDQLVALEHARLADCESALECVALLDVGGLVDQSGGDIGSRFPESADQEGQHQSDEDSEHQMIGVLVQKVLFLFGTSSLCSSGSLPHLRVSLQQRSPFSGRLRSCHVNII